MSKLIRQLLDEQESTFSVQLARIEGATGNPGIDVRLTSDIITASRQCMQELQLDPRDTTGDELFAALSVRCQGLDDYIMNLLGYPASYDAATAGIYEHTRGLVTPKAAWAVKASVMRRIMKAAPPKQVMRWFHFQSVDSMIKRMNIDHIVLAARILESKTWQARYRRQLSDLSARDFETKTIQLYQLTDVRWLSPLEKWKEKKICGVISSKERACAGFAVLPGRATLLLHLVTLMYVINELSVYSSLLKLHYVNPSIGHMLVHAIDENEPIYASVSGIKFHWRDVHCYFSSRVTDRGAVEFAHLDSLDLEWINVPEVLSQIVPDASLWVNSEYCGVSYGDGRVVSLNILDVTRSVSAGLDYRHMATGAMKRSLRTQLMGRYLDHPVVRALVMKQFDISSITEENW